MQCLHRDDLHILIDGLLQAQPVLKHYVSLKVLEERAQLLTVRVFSPCISLSCYVSATFWMGTRPNFGCSQYALSRRESQDWEKSIKLKNVISSSGTQAESTCADRVKQSRPALWKGRAAGYDAIRVRASRIQLRQSLSRCRRTEQQGQMLH